MNSITLSKVTAYLNRILHVARMPDYPDAFNGLQCENRSGRVKKVAAAVDANEFTINAAIEAGADFLLVHHGLFWAKPQPWTERHWRKIRALVEGNLAVYSCHLPLDAHPRFGNNIQIARGLGLHQLQPFLEHKGVKIGWRGRLRPALTAQSVVENLASVLGTKEEEIKVFGFGPKRIRTIGVCSGGAGDELHTAQAAGVDAYVTGEGSHHTFGDAEELGITVFYAGHYATETLGVRSLTEHLVEKFQIGATFIDHPSGL